MAMAMAACAPISNCIFGCVQLGLSVQDHIFSGLAMSRLLYKVNTLCVTKPFLWRLNDAQMRGNRMIRRCPCVDATPESDFQFRLLDSIPSTDCVLATAILPYVGRSVKRRPQSVIALLSCVSRGQRSMWVEQILQDIEESSILSRH